MFIGNSEAAKYEFGSLIGDTIRSVLRARVLPGNYREISEVNIRANGDKTYSHLLECLYKLLPLGGDLEKHVANLDSPAAGQTDQLRLISWCNRRRMKKGEKMRRSWDGPHLVRAPAIRKGSSESFTLQREKNASLRAEKEESAQETSNTISSQTQPALSSVQEEPDRSFSDSTHTGLFVPQFENSETEIDVDSYIYTLPSVTNLHEVGIQVEGDLSPGFHCRVRLKKKSWRWGSTTLKISPLNVDGSTERFLRNLVAFEIVSNSSCKLLTYLQCMDDLINTATDVCLLKESRPAVIQNSSMDEKEVARLFNRMLLNCTVYGNSQLREIRKTVREDYHQLWRRSMEEFSERYCTFSKPWVVISLFAGFLILSLTAIQTVYAVIGNYKK
ncbi:hypothetical protein Mapa_010797 [Marchantia paleacea]|nr:hypothetical protein Mapa_010797 [Marchantia paleacea]